MIAKMLSENSSALIIILCSACLLANNACCWGAHVDRTVINCEMPTTEDCCDSPVGAICPIGDPCNFADCSTIVIPCRVSHIDSLVPRCIETHNMAVRNVNFVIQGSGLANVDTILFRLAVDGSIDNDITVQADGLFASNPQVTAKVDISENAAFGVRRCFGSRLRRTSVAVTGMVAQRMTGRDIPAPPSVATVAVEFPAKKLKRGKMYTAQVKVDLTGVTAPGANQPAAIGSYVVPITFDRTALEFVSVAGGDSAPSASGPTSATNPAAANAPGW